MTLGLSGHVYLQRKPGPWKPSLFCPSGWGGPALQEVPEKLKGTCGKLFVASPAKNNLWREQDSVYCPSPHRKPNESTLSDLPEAPVQGSQSPTLFCTPAPRSGLRASFSADSHPLPSTPLPGRHQPSEPWSPSGHPPPLSSFLSPPPPVSHQHSFSSSGLSTDNALGAAKWYGGHRDLPSKDPLLKDITPLEEMLLEKARLRGK